MKELGPLEAIRQKYEWLAPAMTERMRRLWAAAEAKAVGRGGISLVARATGLSRTTITAGLRDLNGLCRPDKPLLGKSRSRRPGGGRHLLEEEDPNLLRDLEFLIAPSTRGDPMSPLRWTCKSTRQLAKALCDQGHTVSHQTVARLLHDQGYSLQANCKRLEGSDHPDRDAQFEFINARILSFLRANQPAISVDTKKKENLGNFKNGGREWQPEGQPEEVMSKDFPSKDLGKGIPYGIYDIMANKGFLSVGVDHDTARFAVQTQRRWWERMGKRDYPLAHSCLVTADGGGSNSCRNRLWLLSLQELADENGLRICVCHFPPGTSKWNKIEHRLFCHITRNWRSRPLLDRQTMVALIASTRTSTGLVVEAELDEGSYPPGIKVSDEELASMRLQREAFHGEWNYSVTPRQWFVQSHPSPVPAL